MNKKQEKITKQQFWNAAGVEGKLDVVKQAISEGMPVDCRDPSENDTALIKAAYWARFEIAEYLLGLGADINAVDNSMGFSALHFAAYRGTFNHIRLVRLLLDKGARLDMKSRTDPEWPDIKARTPLDAAKQKGNPHIIKLLQDAGAP